MAAIEPVKIIGDAAASNAVAIGTTKATEAFNSAYRVMLKTKYKLSNRQAKKLNWYLGEEIWSLNERKGTSDHMELIISRDLIRDNVDNLLNIFKTSVSTLFIGSTERELKRYGKVPACEFLFNNKEDKDFMRNFIPILTKFSDTINNFDLPLLQSELDAKSLTLTTQMKTIKKLIGKISPDSGFNRVHYSIPNSVFTILHFQDSLYNISEKDFIEYFERTGAVEAHATLFIPNVFIDPTTPESKVYNLKIGNILEDHNEMIRIAAGPLFLAISQVVDGDVAIDFLKDFLFYILSSDLSVIKNFFSIIFNSNHPFFASFLAVFSAPKYYLFLKPIFKVLHSYFYSKFETVTVTWKNGFQNGYYHNCAEWKKWAERARFCHNGIIVDREIVARYGEMYHLKFSLSSGAGVLVHQLDIPEQFKGIKILDFNKSWNVKAKSFGLDLFYTSVYATEFHEALQWALGEQIEALDLDIVVTAVNRLRAGLSINSTELVPSWHLLDKEVVNFSIIVLLETYRIKGVAKTILESKEFLNSYKNTFISNVAKVVFTGFNASLVGIPYFCLSLYHYLVKSDRKVITVQDEYEVPIVYEVPKIIIPGVNSTVNPEDIPVKFVFPKKNVLKKADCEFCALSRSGRFGKQVLNCNNKTVLTQKLTIPASEMGSFYQRILDAIAFHESVAAKSTVEAIKKLKSFIKVRKSEDLVVNCIVHNFEGGPGTGKSTIAREIADYRENQGFSVGIVSPMSDLLEDYSDVKLLDGTSRDDFTFKTTWKAFEMSNRQVLFIEEKSAFDVYLTIALAAMNDTKEIFIIGDFNQTMLQPSEGFSICREDSPINTQLMTSHSLIYNFRCNPLIVKILNERGYSMVSNRTDYKVPEFLTISDYNKLKAKHNSKMMSDKALKPIEEISFSEKSIDVFGTVPNEKHTVRSKQGKTYNKVAVALKEKDTNLLSVHGMINVAISRSRDDVYFVVPASIDDPIVKTLKTELGIDSDENIKTLIDNPWPTFSNSADIVPVDPKMSLIQDSIFQSNVILKTDLETNDYLNRLEQVYYRESGLLEVTVTRYDEINHCLFNSFCEGFKGDPEQLLMLNNRYRNYLLSLEGKGNILTKTDFISFCDLYNYSVFIKSVRDSKPGRAYLSNACRQQFFDFLDSEGKYENFSNNINFIFTKGSHAYSKSQLSSLEQKYLSFIPTNVFYKDMRLLTKISYNGFDRLILELVPWCKPTFDQGFFEDGFAYLVASKVSDIKDRLEHVANTGGIEPITKEDIDSWRNNIAAFIADIFDLEERVGGFTEERSVRFTNVPIKRFSPLQNFDSSIHPVTLPSTKILTKGLVPDTEKLVPIKDRPIKFGKDGYRMFKLLDKSSHFSTKTGYHQLNVFSGVAGLNQEFKIGSRIILDGFRAERTKTGIIKKNSFARGKRSFTPGYGNIFNGDAVETLIAGQRYLVKKSNKPFSQEGKMFAIKVADEFYRKNFKKHIMDRTVAKDIEVKAIKDMETRLYWKRGQAELRKKMSRKLVISFHNRKIFKPEKNRKISLMKGGQGIAQTPSWFNYEHCPTMRLLNADYHDSLQDFVFYDNLEPTRKFRQRLTRAISRLPYYAKTAITDAQQFDAFQNWFTVEIEKRVRTLQGVSNKFIESYFRCRDKNTFRAYGKFSGQTNGEKGSGFLDTLLGNSTTSMVLSDKIVDGIGVKVTAGKGDDFLKVQSAIKFNEQFQKDILAFCNLRFNYQISDGGEFCGDVVGRSGCYPSITRMAMKAFETKAVKYKEGFSENQISFRDKVKDVLECGVNRTIAANMLAEKRSYDEVRTALNAFVSIGHLSKYQWEKNTSTFYESKFQLPSARGLSLPFVQIRKPLKGF